MSHFIRCNACRKQISPSGLKAQGWWTIAPLISSDDAYHLCPEHAAPVLGALGLVANGSEE